MLNIEQVKERLCALDDALENKLPGIATILRDIHANLKKDPELVTILSPEECSIIVRGLKRQTATEIVTTAKTKSKKQISLGDL